MASSPIGAGTEQKSSSSELEGCEQSMTVEQRLDRLEKAALWIKEFLISTTRAPVHDGNGENASSGFVTPSVDFVVTPDNEEKTLPLEIIVEQPVKETTPDTVDPLESELDLQVSVDLAKGDVKKIYVAEETVIPSLGNIVDQLVCRENQNELIHFDLGKSDLGTCYEAVPVEGSIYGTKEKCSACSSKTDRIWEPGGLPIKPEMFETSLQGISKSQSPHQEEPVEEEKQLLRTSDGLVTQVSDHLVGHDLRMKPMGIMDNCFEVQELVCVHGSVTDTIKIIFDPGGKETGRILGSVFRQELATLDKNPERVDNLNMVESKPIGNSAMSMKSTDGMKRFIWEKGKQNLTPILLVSRTIDNIDEFLRISLRGVIEEEHNSGFSKADGGAKMSLIQDGLFCNLMQLGMTMSPLVLSTNGSIILNIYRSLHTELKIQLEATELGNFVVSAVPLKLKNFLILHLEDKVYPSGTSNSMRSVRELINSGGMRVIAPKTWAQLPKTFCSSGNLELELMYQVQMQCYEDAKLVKAYPEVGRSLYELDILLEFTFMQFVEGRTPGEKLLILHLEDKCRRRRVGRCRSLMQHMARFSSIDLNTHTFWICGYPNVGKSSFMNKETGADVDVQPYTFTDYKYLRCPVLDTPAMLDRPIEDRNLTELCSITALAYLRAAILFFLDISGSCGDNTIAQQAALVNIIRSLFMNKPLVIVCNRNDLMPMENMFKVDWKLIEETEVEAMKTAVGTSEEAVSLKMSILTGEGVMTVKNDSSRGYVVVVEYLIKLIPLLVSITEHGSINLEDKVVIMGGVLISSVLDMGLHMGLGIEVTNQAQIHFSLMSDFFT